LELASKLLNIAKKRDRSLHFGLLNSRSDVRKTASIHDVIADHKLDVIALTELWVRSDDPAAVNLDIAPPDYSVLHALREVDNDTLRRGGGVALHYAVPIVTQGNITTS